jgi:hypothetical protein
MKALLASLSEYGLNNKTRSSPGLVLQAGEAFLPA